MRKRLSNLHFETHCCCSSIAILGQNKVAKPPEPKPLSLPNTYTSQHQKTSSSSPKSHFRAVNFRTLTLGVLGTAGVLCSRLIPLSLNPTFSTSLLSNASIPGFWLLFFVGERHCSSRSIASSLRRRVAFSDSNSEMRSAALGVGSLWTGGC